MKWFFKLLVCHFCSPVPIEPHSPAPLWPQTQRSLTVVFSCLVGAHWGTGGLGQQCSFRSIELLVVVGARKGGPEGAAGNSRMPVTVFQSIIIYCLLCLHSDSASFLDRAPRLPRPSHIHIISLVLYTYIHTYIHIYIYIYIYIYKIFCTVLLTPCNRPHGRSIP